METITLQVTETSYATAKDARKANRIPIAYYAKGVQNRSFSVGYQEFRRAYEKGGRSTILTLTNEKKDALFAIVHEMQYDPITDQVIHVDMMAVDMNKPIRTKLPIRLVGIAPAVRDLAGVLVQSKASVEVECLPKDLIPEIKLDVSGIADFHTSLKVRDLQLPQEIKILDALDISVATVAAPRPTEEEEAAKAAAEAAKVAEATAAAPGAEGAKEGEGEAKKEGGKEGAEAPAKKEKEKK